MKIYTVKLRMFPPRRDLEDWFEEDPTTWEWDDFEYGEVIKTIYGRRIMDETGRPGVSVQLQVVVNEENLAANEIEDNPEKWGWHGVAGLTSERDVEFIRAAFERQVDDDNVLHCYHCEKPIFDKAWTDGEGSGYCSSKCIDEVMGVGSYRVTPEGTILKEGK